MTKDEVIVEMGYVARALAGVGPRDPVVSTVTEVVQIGGLFAMTGRLATFGENELAAAQLAVEQVNALLVSLDIEWRLLDFVVEDTQTDPALCLEAVESFAGRGIKLLIGPLSSAEVRAIKGYCDANKILAISQSSTAPDLAIADDFIFRFCPTDKGGQGPAIGRMMYDDGKRYVIPVAVNDAWGVGLEVAATQRFEELGGTVLEGIRYVPGAPEFSAEASDLASKVQSAVDLYGGPTQVCVLHIAFEEVTSWFTAASEYEVLSSVKWYGSDGTAGSSAMLEDPGVSAFSVMVDYPSPIFAPTESAKWEMVRQNGVDVLGRDPESYSYGVYDVVWAYALSVLKADSSDPEDVKEVLPEVAQSFFGASGWIELDEAGDRLAGDYVIWQVVETSPGEYEWQIVGKFILATDSVEWYI
jgi:branched-chain amino acid transport system substrate-binding protein